MPPSRLGRNALSTVSRQVSGVQQREQAFGLRVGGIRGIALVGSEVKSLRNGKSTISESYAQAKDGELFLVNAYIPEYTQASRFNHEPKRVRKLLVHKREAAKLAAAIQREGMTLVPLKMYFNAKGRAKVQLGIAKGKKLHDKRETEKQRDWQRDKARLLRDRG